MLGMDWKEFLFKDRSGPAREYTGIQIIAIAIASFFVLVLLAAIVFDIVFDLP